MILKVMVKAKLKIRIRNNCHEGYRYVFFHCMDIIIILIDLLQFHILILAASFKTYRQAHSMCLNYCEACKKFEILVDSLN